MLTLWEQLEEVLFDHDALGTTFTSHEVAERLGVPWQRASGMIQSYLRAQRAQDSRTLYALHRMPGTRTAAAVWKVGARAKDINELSAALWDDVRCQLVRATKPDIMKVARLNPAARRSAVRAVESWADGALVLLRNNVADIIESNGRHEEAA